MRFDCNTVKFFYRKKPALSLQEARYQTLCMLQDAYDFQSYFSIHNEDNINIVKLVQKSCSDLTKEGIEIKSIELPCLHSNCIKCVESDPNFIKWIDIDYNDIKYYKCSCGSIIKITNITNIYKCVECNTCDTILVAKNNKGYITENSNTAQLEKCKDCTRIELT